MFPLTLRYVLRTTQGAWKRKKSTRRVYTFFCLDISSTSTQVQKKQKIKARIYPWFGDDFFYIKM